MTARGGGGGMGGDGGEGGSKERPQKRGECLIRGKKKREEESRGYAKSPVQKRIFRNGRRLTL